MNCSTIVNGFISSDVDLIMANATAALQAAFTGTETIPVLGTSITDYATALDLDEDYGLWVRFADGRETKLNSGEVSIRPEQGEAVVQGG